MVDQISIAWITAELDPFVKVGGLADVSAALPKKLTAHDLDVRIILPYYGVISEEYDIQPLGIAFKDFRGETCEVYKTKLIESEVTVYLLQHTLFSGDVYDGDLGLKFSTFSWLASRLFDQVQWYPDIVHANDWHTAPILPILDEIEVMTVFTIHNLAYQGVESSSYLRDIGLEDLLVDDEAETNFLELGIKYADQVSTVSSTYAEEILTPEYGNGLEQVLKEHPRDIVGITHGIDTDEYNPSTDIYIKKPYTMDTLKDKLVNKLSLQEQANLEKNPKIFTIGMVTRLVDQKGVNLLAEIIPVLVEHSIQIIILGTGEDELEKKLQRLQYAYPEHMNLFMMYNVPLSHEMFAGLDALVVPSRYEPCGLTQLYAMTYGTVPIVRKTGGLVDTVTEEDDKQTGFIFKEFESNALYQAIIRALQSYRKPDDWKQIQRNGMQQDLGWDKPSSQWIKLYRDLLQSDI